MNEVLHGAGTRVVAMLNGLGSAKYEELFVTFTSVTSKLRDADSTSTVRWGSS